MDNLQRTILSVKYIFLSDATPMQKRQQKAAQNRQDLLDAAVIIFRKYGIRAPLQLVIDEAEVGRATFYRNFKDRRELVLALMEQALTRLELRAKHYAQYPDGFIQLIRNHVDNLPYLTALMEYWRVIDLNDIALVEIYQKQDAILQPLIDQAIANGKCRPDMTPKDYAMITAILRSSFQGLDNDAQKTLASRAIDLLIDGLKAS